MRTPKVRSAAGELFWMGVRGVLPLTSISYTSENVTKREGIAHQRHDPAEFGNARSRHRVSIPSGVAGTNLRKTTHYEGKNCDPLQHFPEPVDWFEPFERWCPSAARPRGAMTSIRSFRSYTKCGDGDFKAAALKVFESIRRQAPVLIEGSRGGCTLETFLGS